MKKLNLLWIIGLMFIIVMSGFVFAGDQYNESLDSNSWTCVGTVNAAGMKISPDGLDNMSIVSVQKSAGSIADVCELTSENHQNLYATGSYVDDICTFNGTYQLNKSANYYIVNNVTPSRNYCWQQGDNTPFDTGNITWLDAQYEYSNNWADVSDNLRYEIYAIIYEFIEPPPIEAPIVNLINPIDDTFSSGTDFNISYNTSADHSIIINASLWTNITGTWQFNKSNSTAVINNSVNYFNDTYFPSDHFIWNVQVCDNNTNCSFATNNYTISPLDILFPEFITDFINNSIYFSRNLTGQWNITDNDNIHTLNVTLPLSNITIFNKTNIDTTAYSFNLSQNITNLSPGDHILSFYIADGHTAEELKGDYEINKGLFGDYLKYTFYDYGSIRTQNKESSIFDNWDSERLKDRYIQIYEPANPKETQTFIEESETPIYILTHPTKYKGSWIVTGTHWKDYVLENEPDSKVSIKRINDYKVEVTISGIKNKERLIFNSVGDLNILNINYTFTIINVTETFESGIINNFSTTLTLDFFGTDQEVHNISLEWNNTNLTPSLSFTNSTQSRYSISFIPNLDIEDKVNISHKWFFNLTDETIPTDSTDFQNQTVLNIRVDECDGTTIYNIVNISYFDELNGSQLNTTNEYNLIFYDGTYYYNQIGGFNESDNHTFCTNAAPTELNYTWSMYGTMKIEKDTYTTRFIEIQIGSPEIVGNDPSLNLSFLLITTSNSSTIKFTWLTTQYQTIDGTMKIFRCNPDGTKTLADSVVIVSGTAVSNIQLLFQQYSYEIIVGGTTFTDTSFTTCHIETSTEATYFVDIAPIDITPIIGLILTSCTLTNSSANTVNMSWSSNSEDLITDIEGCIIAYRGSVFGNIKIYENCSTTSPTSPIVRTIPDNANAYYVTGELRQGENIKRCDDIISFFTESDTSRTFGLMGIFAVILIIATTALVFAGDGKNVLFGAGIGIIVSFVIGIMALPWEIVMAMITFLIIIGMIGRYVRKI